MYSFADKKILITGGAGSLGSEIVKRLLPHAPAVIRVYSRDEGKQFALQQTLRQHTNIRYLLGDIRDVQRLAHAMHDIDIVFHAAALKHVPACEYNPFEALKTNIIGTANVIDAAVHAGVDKLVFTSTDKATNPSNAMGTSKLFAERLMASAQYYSGACKTTLCTVRFGNVLGSRGSFVPLLIKQIQQGGPITLTHSDMTRFFMSVEHALDMMCHALTLARGGEVFVLKMPVMRIPDLIAVMVDVWAPYYGYDPADIVVETIGVKPGEKLYEELLTVEECKRAIAIDTMYVLPPQTDAVSCADDTYVGGKKVTRELYASHKETPLTRPEIKAMLDEAALLPPIRKG